MIILKRFLAILSLFFLMDSSYCQTGKYMPFKLVVISPDSAMIDLSLKGFIDTIEQCHLKSYYSSIKQMEKMLAFKDFPDDMKKQFEETRKLTKANLDSALKFANEVKKFRFYQTISEYSSSVFQFYFNEYPPFSTFQLVKNYPLTITQFKHLSDSLDANYIVGYKNIHSENNDGQIILKLTTLLYSRKEDKILLQKETLGDVNSTGSMWTCSNPLECLLINGVKTSTDNIFEILSKKQLK